MSGKDLENATLRPALPPGAPQARLTVTTPEGRSTCETTAPVILIGSRRDCLLPVLHPDVSKVHSAVLNTGRALLVCDLLSRTGTFVNDQPVRIAALQPGDRLRVGPLDVAVEFASPSTPAPAEPAGAAGEPLLTGLALELADQRIEIGRVAAIIGRRHGADLILDHPDVSLAHALLFSVGGRPAVCDLGSRSGTLVNTVRTDLGWLEDGDELDIAGQKLTVRWQPPEIAPAPAVATSAAEQAAPDGRENTCPAAAPPTAAPSNEARVADAVATNVDPADLADLERTIAAVQAQINGARSRLDERQQELERREAELSQRWLEWQSQNESMVAAQTQLQQREQDLARQRDELANERAAFEMRGAELEALDDQLRQREQELRNQDESLAAERAQRDELRAALEQQQQALQEATRACGQKEEELQARQQQLETAVAELNGQRQQADDERAALERESTATAQAAAALEQQGAELAARQAEFNTREQALAAREAALAERETQQRVTAQKIEAFRSVLQRATGLFAPAAPGGPTPAPAAQAPQASAQPPAAPTESVATNVGNAAAAGEPLPAPMVDRPIFAADTKVPPPDWPAELRERYRVLRRVSNKSDSELLAQVWAERKCVPPQRPEANRTPAKKRRLRWGN